MKSNIQKYLLAAGFIFVLLEIWGALNPSYRTWGIQMFGFYDTPVALLAVAAGLTVFLPRVQRVLLHRVDSLAGLFVKRPAWVSFIVLSVILVLLGILLPAKLHLLGDGALLLRVIAGLGLSGETPPAFNHQPLVAMIFTGIRSISDAMKTIPADTLFRIIDSVIGLLFILILFLWIRTLSVKTSDKIILGSLLLLTGGSQFFFGYAELYVFLYTMTAAYVITGWMALEKKIPIVIPFVCFGIMAGLHFSVLILSPSLLILFYHGWKNKKLTALPVAGGIALLAIAVYAVTRIDFSAVMSRSAMEVRYNFLPLLNTEGYFPYTIFSLNHFIDWANANLLIAPFGIAIAAIILIGSWKDVEWKSPVLWFLGAAALFGIGFTFTVNTALGMARDWDFLASFFLPLIILNIYLLKPFIQNEQFKRGLVAIIVLMALHTFAWIGVNASEERHLARYRKLDDAEFLSNISRLNYHETLGAFFYARSDMQNASIYFNKYLEVDSSNTRILANISQVYKRLGNEDGEFRWLSRAAALNSPNPVVYMNLGVLYAHRKDTASAIAMNERAVGMDSAFAKAHANLGILHMLQDRYEQAAFHYSKAIDNGLTEHFLYRDAASAYFLLGQYEESLRYYDQYVALEPGDMRAKSVRDQLENWMKTGKQ